VEALRCPFRQTLITGEFGCRHALAVTRREGPDVGCSSDAASRRCSELFERLKAVALPASDDGDAPSDVPHSALVKVQHGGLLGLQRLLAPRSGSSSGRVDDVDRLLEQVLLHYGGLEAIPYAEVLPDVEQYKIRRRRAR
jgi:hypothetical protein